jgi:hypothetical protein
LFCYKKLRILTYTLALELLSWYSNNIQIQEYGTQFVPYIIWKHKGAIFALIIIALSAHFIWKIGSDVHKTDVFPRNSPHIIFILTDDQGSGDMVVWSLNWLNYKFLKLCMFKGIAGSDFENLMPSIQQLSKAGVNFTHYYSGSRCTPGRSSLITGSFTLWCNLHGQPNALDEELWHLQLLRKLKFMS